MRGALDAGHKSTNKKSITEAWRALSRNPVYVFVFIGMIFASAASSGLLIWIPSLFVRVHGLSLYQAGLIVATAALIFGTLGTIAGGAIGDRLMLRREPTVMLILSTEVTGDEQPGVTLNRFRQATGPVGPWMDRIVALR